MQTAIETRSLGEQVYQRLCNQIIEGSIDYGACLNIKKIAGELKVSSMPVREAIKRLEMEGVVAVKPRSTCIVRVPTQASVLNALDMRELLEMHCINSIFPDISPARLAGLKEITRTMNRIVEKGKTTQEIREYRNYDRRYHTELCSLADNHFIDKFYRETSLHLNMKFIYDIAIPPDIVGTYHDHSEILDALARNSRQAVTIMKKHLQRSRQNVLSGRLFSSLKNSET
jgi:DNA-binding GntR family transcriptional regulator